MAIDENTIELINADVDGELGDSERAQLHAYLAQNEEARALHRELGAFCRQLDDVEPVEPPQHLKFSLLDSFRSRPKPVAPALPAWRQMLAVPMLRHAVAFTAGVFLTLALVSSNRISDSAFDDVTGLVGTIADSGLAYKSENSINLARNDIAGTVSIHESGSLTVVDVNLSSKETIEIIAGYSDRDLWFRGFAQLEKDDAKVVADKGEVRMSLKGRNRYAIYLQQASRTPASIHLRFYAGGNLVHEADLMLDNAAAGRQSEQEEIPPTF